MKSRTNNNQKRVCHRWLNVERHHGTHEVKISINQKSYTMANKKKNTDMAKLAACKCGSHVALCLVLEDYKIHFDLFHFGGFVGRSWVHYCKSEGEPLAVFECAKDEFSIDVDPNEAEFMTMAETLKFYNYDLLEHQLVK